MFYRPRLLGTIDYVSASRKSFDIDLDGMLNRLLLNVRYTVTNGGVAAGAPQFQTLARIFRRIIVKVGGRDTVTDISGEMLAALNQVWYGTPADGMNDTIATGVTVATSYDITLSVPFTVPNGRNPHDAGLPLPKTSQATLAIDWANSDASAFYNTTGTASIGSVTCSVHADYKVPRAGEGFPVVQGVHELREISKDLSATDAQFSTDLDARTGALVREVAVATLVADQGSNAVLNTNNGTLKLVSGSITHQEWESRVLQAKMQQDFSMDEGRLITGFYTMPTAEFGSLVEAINTSPQVLPAPLRCVLDATKQSGTNTIKYVVSSVRPPRFVEL